MLKALLRILIAKKSPASLNAELLRHTQMLFKHKKQSHLELSVSCYTVETVFLKTEVLPCFNGIILTLIADNCLALKSENDRISGSTVGLQTCALIK